MSPINNAPLRGYADWQRTQNYDSGVLASLAATPTNGSVASSVIDVSRYAYLAGQIQTATNPMQVSLQWGMDSLLATQVGVVTFQVHPSIGLPMQLRTVNMGPFCRVFVNSLGAIPYSPSWTVFGSNRVYPSLTTPGVSHLVRIGNAAIGAGTSITVFPLDYFAGANQCFFLGTTAGSWFTTYEILDSNNVWNTAMQRVVSTANVPDIYAFVSPLGVWRVSILNQGGIPGNAYLSVTASMTGAT